MLPMELLEQCQGRRTTQTMLLRRNQCQHRWSSNTHISNRCINMRIPTMLHTPLQEVHLRIMDQQQQRINLPSHRITWHHTTPSTPIWPLNRHTTLLLTVSSCTIRLQTLPPLPLVRSAQVLCLASPTSHLLRPKTKRGSVISRLQAKEGSPDERKRRSKSGHKVTFVRKAPISNGNPKMMLNGISRESVHCLLSKALKSNLLWELASSSKRTTCDSLQSLILQKCVPRTYWSRRSHCSSTNI
mmetsp:Transcript_9258/g.34246  ORF Transcript_9258/g.34246 Transcript_9258/m.34246 type:complete len:243 (-) Transcript_9258:3303-4031(-)